ncbi:winged helix-turn-helix transcriptional regulator [uncultured Anaeromusa sp.]|uniref:winged helix-turn-helix transcriptional regulator n=1 Tax=uncultured Anaeromusa sp. TaxID=673273 RepID=UPI0029C767E4|nr:winged helix-turn-helix transcriptional regulator [uncultured Anaeromusa sp.]
MNTTANEEQLLKQLAATIVEKPRSTIKELAESVGISKATLHRFCGTRENLQQILTEKSRESLDSIIKVAQKDYQSYQDGIRHLVNIHYENKEYLIFTCGMHSSIENAYWVPYMKAIDSFFLNGQKKGAFKIDFNVAVLSELFISVICGMIDAEKRKRIASNGIEEVLEKFFLYGALEDSSK